MKHTIKISGISSLEDGLYEAIPTCSECFSDLVDLKCERHGDVRFMRMRTGKRISSIEAAQAEEPKPVDRFLAFAEKIVSLNAGQVPEINWKGIPEDIRAELARSIAPKKRPWWRFW